MNTKRLTKIKCQSLCCLTDETEDYHSVFDLREKSRGFQIVEDLEIHYLELKKLNDSIEDELLQSYTDFKVTFDRNKKIKDVDKSESTSRFIFFFNLYREIGIPVYFFCLNFQNILKYTWIQRGFRIFLSNTRKNSKSYI